MSELRVGCELAFEVERPAEIVLQVAVARTASVTVSDDLVARLDDRPVPVFALDAPDGDRLHVITAATGRLHVTYNAHVITRPARSAVPPLQRIAALRPSRYCPSDRLFGFAAGQFGPVDPLDPAAVAAALTDVVAFVNTRTRYEAGVSSATTDAAGTLLAGAGVCRDFAHLVATLARALGIPTRIAAVYAPGLSPMDFHAVVEAAVGGRWLLFDATRLAPRPSMVRIATGPDAATTAFATVQAGTAELTGMEVRAVVEGDLPNDDGTGSVELP
jgi:transglutaminase-like putative cysteine protease